MNECSYLQTPSLQTGKISSSWAKVLLTEGGVTLKTRPLGLLNKGSNPPYPHCIQRARKNFHMYYAGQAEAAISEEAGVTCSDC